MFGDLQFFTLTISKSFGVDINFIRHLNVLKINRKLTKIDEIEEKFDSALCCSKYTNITLLQG